MVSTKAVRQALYERLNHSSVTTLLDAGSASLYHQVAPPLARYPFVVFNKQAGTSSWRMGGNAMDSHLWLVKGIVRGTSSSTAEDISKAVADRLDFQTLTITGGTNVFMARESDVDYGNVDGDQTYRHHGALYRVVVQD